MLTVFVWGILSFEAAVYCEKDLVDFSSITSRIILNPQGNVESPSLEASPEIDSSEHGVTPGERQTSCPCGRANRDQARIVGGRQFRPFEYPFLAAISYSTKPQDPHCGSTIISDRHLLTAAHCTSMAGGDIGLLVIVAVHAIGNSPRSYTVEVERLIQHENYDKNYLFNDISLLYLKNPLQLTEVVSVACMPLPGLSVIGKYVRVIGWGATKFKGLMTVRPQKVDLRVIDTQKCHQYWPWNVATDPVTNICTMSRKRTTCNGDSGSPVVWLDPDTNRYTIVGIVSAGPPCVDSSPTIHTSVVSYLPWILKGIEGNLCVMCAASSFMWMEPLSQWLKKEVNATTSDISWLTSSIEFSDILLVLPCSLLADIWGRRTVLLIIGPLCIISWALAMFTRGLIFLYLVRCIQGIILGVVFAVAPMYTAEISSSKIRGCLGANFSVMWCLGTLYTYATGHYTSYGTYILCLSIIPLLFFFSFIFMPESPYYYFMVKDNAKAATALKWLRSGEDINREFSLTQKAVLNDMKQKGGWIDLFATSSDRRAFLIVQIVAFVRYMSGLTAIVAFASDTFASDADRLIKPKQFTLAMGIILCISALFSSFFSDTVGRRRLLIWSTIGSTLSNLSISIYFFLQEKTSVNVQPLIWMKYLGVASFCICANLGFGQLIQTVQAEFFPTHTRCLGGAVTGVTSAIFAFISLKLYDILNEIFGIYMNFLTFTLVSLIGAIMTFVYIPESANKDLAEVNENIKKITMNC